MKNLILAFVGFVSFSISAQDVVLEINQAIPFQDSLYVMYSKTVTCYGYGFCDTVSTVSSTPVSRESASGQLFAAYANRANELTGRMIRARGYKGINEVKQRYRAELQGVGLDVDSMLIDQYKTQFIGEWSYINAGGLERSFVLTEHPSRTDALLMDGTPINYDFFIVGEKNFMVNLGGANGNMRFVWSETIGGDQVFRPENSNVPENAGIQTRWIKKG